MAALLSSRHGTSNICCTGASRSGTGKRVTTMRCTLCGQTSSHSTPTRISARDRYSQHVAKQCTASTLCAMHCHAQRNSKLPPTLHHHRTPQAPSWAHAYSISCTLQARPTPPSPASRPPLHTRRVAQQHCTAPPSVQAQLSQRHASSPCWTVPPTRPSTTVTDMPHNHRNRRKLFLEAHLLPTLLSFMTSTQQNNLQLCVTL